MPGTVRGRSMVHTWEGSKGPWSTYEKGPRVHGPRAWYSRARDRVQMHAMDEDSFRLACQSPSNCHDREIWAFMFVVSRTADLALIFIRKSFLPTVGGYFTSWFRHFRRNFTPWTWASPQRKTWEQLDWKVSNFSARRIISCQMRLLGWEERRDGPLDNF